MDDDVFVCPFSSDKKFFPGFGADDQGYREQIVSLNSKCKTLTMEAKHTTMLLTVTEVEGMEELDPELLLAPSVHPSVVM